jgi:LmbE family N-acetylglucosaminyl deacetylase
VGAHPDDVEFGCGATLAKWAAAGTRVHHLVLTDGSKGSWDPDRDIEELVATRRDEQRAAAAALGGGDVTFLGQVDGELAHSTDIVAAVAREIRRIRPGVVLGHDPWKRYRLHPDHRHAGFIVTDAIVAARDPHFLRDSGLSHHRPDALLLWEADEPNHVEDVTAHLEVKLRALRAHESQFESTMKANDPGSLAAFEERMRARAGELGAPHGVVAAEVFRLIAPL